ncbi:Endoribonuclease Dicer [Eufriesea mexicana]|nr:Endoribonuclease Dicer [Eufriesea mexicana]
METADDFIPRAYQLELFETACKQNTIIYLPTGAGKTYIAVMLIKELSGDLQISYDKGGKCTVFVVNTVPLVMQQSEYIRRLTGFPCASLSGDIGIDDWSAIEWNEQLNKFKVLVMTSQILTNALLHGYILLNKINLIIFDECHRAVNNHPMRQIMQFFQYHPKEEQPKILGLSATLLNHNAKSQNISTLIKSLEVTFHAKIITTQSVLQNYCTNPQEKIIVFKQYILPNVTKLVNNIIEEMQEILENLVFNDSLNTDMSSKVFKPKPINKKLKLILTNFQKQFSFTGIYGANLCTINMLIFLESMKRLRTETNLEIIHVLKYLTTGVTKCRKLLEDEMKNNTEKEKIYNYSSDKILELLRILKKFNDNKNKELKFCCMIFVQERCTVNILYQIIKAVSMYDEEYKFLHPDMIVGASCESIYKKALCLRKWSRESLHRIGLSNCIITTDILDEGIDIPLCSLIIRYDIPLDVRTYIQSKGRTRSKLGQYIILMQEGKSNERNLPTENELKVQLYSYKIEPYISDNLEKKCYITSNTAIFIINKYCQSLLKCKFVTLSPTWTLYNDSNKLQFQVSLKLPIASPLRTTIFGDLMSNIRDAKKSVALKACIELYKIGELNDDFEPVTFSFLQKNLNYLFPNWIDEDETEKAFTIGTYKKKRCHQLQFPSVLCAAFPLPQQITYLHIFHVKPKYAIPHYDNRYLVFYNLLHNDAGFGILSAKQMPEIPSFPIFMSVGELDIDVKVNHTKIFLSKEEVKLIKDFHSLIFSEIITVIKTFMVFDNYNLDNCFLIVPVDKNWNINWEVMTQYKSIVYVPPTVPTPNNFETNYELALVKPNYRVADIYIVTKVCDDITPNSCFPTDNFVSYADYYKEKHGLIINDLDQPMLEVKAISKNIDYIMPRFMQREAKNPRYADASKNLKEHLVPELCIKINFPALYWLKATILPSILHRTSQLLVAEDLRQIIAKEANLGSLTSNKRWSPLTITEEEQNETFESLLETATTENVDDLQSEPVLSGPEVDVLNVEAYHYPWSKHEEPLDLYKNATEIQLIQIEYYMQFMYETDNENRCIMPTINNFKNKPLISVLPLQILSLKNSCGPNPVQILYALTAKSGLDAFNLERLEILGDSYLKFIVSVFLYNNFPRYNEGILTSLKGKIIGNRNLCYCGMKKNIPGRMKVDSFIPLSNFIAPAYTVFRDLQNILLKLKVSPNVLYEIVIPRGEQISGLISDDTKNIIERKILDWETAELQTGMEHYLGIQTVSDKTVADCVEALIGAYLISLGIEDTVTLLKWFQILPNDINIDALLLESPKIDISEEKINNLLRWVLDIETRIGYKFKNRSYLLEAYTHPSYTPNNITGSYEKLEFLVYIYENCKNINPGTLTDLRSALVNNITFACLAVRHGLHTALLSYTPQLSNVIERFVKYQEERNHVINDELLWILLEECECKVAEYVDVPKVLGDIFESTIGAIYLDSNKNLTVVWEIIYSIMYDVIEKFSKNIPKQPIRVLYEIQGAQPQFLDSNVIDNTGIIMTTLKVIIAGKAKLFHGFGTNTKQAKCAAAKLALKSLLHKS